MGSKLMVKFAMYAEIYFRTFNEMAKANVVQTHPKINNHIQSWPVGISLNSGLKPINTGIRKETKTNPDASSNNVTDLILYS